MKKGIRNWSLLLMFLLAGTFVSAQDDSAESNDNANEDTDMLYKQWKNPQRYRLPPAVNTLLADEVSPAISRDGRTLVFQSNRGKGKGYGLYMTMRTDDGKWTSPKPLESINGKAGDSTVIAGPFMSYDGMTLYYSANFDDSKGGMDLYMSSRESMDAEFGEPVNLGDVNTGDYEGFPTVSADGRRLYFMRRAEGDMNNSSEAGSEDSEATGKKGSERVWCYTAMVAKMSADEKYGMAEEVEGVINEDCSKAFRIMPDGETMYYVSMRDGAKRQGNTKGIRAEATDFDMFMVQMDEGSESWGEPMAADFANHLSSEGYVTVAPDDGAHTVMYFDANMNASREIFWTLVPPGFAPRRVMMARGNVEDSVTGEPVYTIMKFENLTRPSLGYDKYNDEETGKFSTVITEGNKYKVSIDHEDYLPYVFMWDFTDPDEITNLYQRVRLVPKGVEVMVSILDAIDEQPVDAKLTVKAEDDTSIGDINKTGTGKYETRLEPGQVYTLTAEAFDNYMEESDTLDLTEAKFGDKVSKILYMLDATKVQFDNINFATARWNLNADAQAELDKVYKFLTDYPKMKIRIEAHTDYRGGDSYNQRLSQNRAKSAYDYLIGKGISADRLESEGYGEARPAVPNEVNGRQNAANMAINRRVEFKIVR